MTQGSRLISEALELGPPPSPSSSCPPGHDGYPAGREKEVLGGSAGSSWTLELTSVSSNRGLDKKKKSVSYTIKLLQKAEETLYGLTGDDSLWTNIV